MLTTIDLPDELLARAKSRAALAGLSLKEFFIEAVEQKLTSPSAKVRRPPPVMRRIRVLTPGQIDDAMLG
jgi:hypothetical protein